MKRCARCREEFPLREYGARGKATYCKKCYSEWRFARIELAAREFAGEVAEKTCRRCKRTLAIEEFSWREVRKQGRHPECDLCRDPNGPKYCPLCRELKPKGDFHPRRGSLSSYCKSCNKEYCREQSRRRQYGLAPEEYEAAVKAQNGCCAICGKRTELLWVDHDHSCCPKNMSCGKCRRGLLCMMCNGGLGMFLDDVETLKKAIAYLETHENAVALAHGVLFRVA